MATTPSASAIVRSVLHGVESLIIQPAVAPRRRGLPSVSASSTAITRSSRPRRSFASAGGAQDLGLGEPGRHLPGRGPGRPPGAAWLRFPACRPPVVGLQVELQAPGGTAAARPLPHQVDQARQVHLRLLPELDHDERVFPVDGFDAEPVGKHANARRSRPDSAPPSAAGRSDRALSSSSLQISSSLRAAAMRR